MVDKMPRQLHVCHCCGLNQEVPPLTGRQFARCARCHTKLLASSDHHQDNLPALAAAISALILFVPAVSLPIMQLKKLGFVQDSSIIGGSLALLQHGELIVGLVVLVCSVIFPVGKLIAILVLCLKPPRKAQHVAIIHKLVEQLGRWGMIDIVLVAIMVSALKLGDLVQVSPGPAALLFTLMVILSILASAWFNPHLLWLKFSRIK